MLNCLNVWKLRNYASGHFDPSFLGIIMVATWAVLWPQPIGKFGLLVYCIFLLDLIWGVHARFRSLTRAVDSMLWLINRQLVTLGWLTQKKTKWPNRVLSFTRTEYSWNATQNQHATWTAGTMKSFFKVWFISTSFILFLSCFYSYFYSTGFFGSSYVEDYLKHAILIKVFCIKPKLCFCPFEDMILSICNQVILKVCLHPFTLSVANNSRRELETQSLNKFSKFLASTWFVTWSASSKCAHSFC